MDHHGSTIDEGTTGRARGRRRADFAADAADVGVRRTGAAERGRQAADAGTGAVFGAAATRRAAVLAAALAGLGAAAARRASAQTPDPERGAGWVAIRTYQLKPEADRATLLLVTEEGFVPLLREQPGFVAFYVLEPDPLTWMAVSVWDSRDAAAASAEVARAWVAENVQASVASGPESLEAGVNLVAFAGDAATPAA
jgi:heme-degrading monooxygenase HmoA